MQSKVGKRVKVEEKKEKQEEKRYKLFENSLIIMVFFPQDD